MLFQHGVVFASSRLCNPEIVPSSLNKIFVTDVVTYYKLNLMLFLWSSLVIEGRIVVLAFKPVTSPLRT